MNIREIVSVEQMHARRVNDAWNAIAPRRIAQIRYEVDAVMVLHPTKGWRRISHKRLGLV